MILGGNLAQGLITHRYAVFYSMMQFSIFTSVVLILCASFFSSCVSMESQVAGDFVKSVTFSPFDTFSYKHTLISGMDWRGSEEFMTEELSERVLSSELVARGFERVDDGADFFVVSKWRKAVSSYPGVFDHIDGPSAALNDRRNPSSQAAVRYTLIVEIYQAESNELFWRVEFANLFDAIQYTETRVVASLKRAIRDFPHRVEKDLSLPNIQ